METPRILALPAELRNTIYGYCLTNQTNRELLVSRHAIQGDDDNSKTHFIKSPRPPALSNVCRQLYAEVLHIFYTENILTFYKDMESLTPEAVDQCFDRLALLGLARCIKHVRFVSESKHAGIWHESTHVFSVDLKIDNDGVVDFVLKRKWDRMCYCGVREAVRQALEVAAEERIERDQRLHLAARAVSAFLDEQFDPKLPCGDKCDTCRAERDSNFRVAHLPVSKG